MDQRTITLISFGIFKMEFLEMLAVYVTRAFNLQVSLREGHLDLSDFYDSARRQYNGNKLLRELDYSFSSDSLKTIGLFNVDLFIPILTYIFGQAMLNGKTGIVSLYRLGNERYGMEKNENLLLVRFRKEIIHELGHTFGLIHCHNTDCVMRSSTYVEDIDQKNDEFCLKCKETLNSLSI